jgi:WD40 repeat protein
LQSGCLCLLIPALIGCSGGSGVIADTTEPPGLDELGSIEQLGLHVFALTFSPDGKSLAVASGLKPVQIIDVATRKRVLEIGNLKPNFDDEFDAIALAPDGKTLALGETCRTEDNFIAFAGRVHLADFATGKIVKTVAFEWPPEALAYTPDGKKLAVALMSGDVHLLDATNLEMRRLFHDPKQGRERRRRDIAHIAFNSEGNRLAVAFRSMRGPHQPPPDPDEEIQVWDVGDGQLIHRLLNTGAGGADSVGFAPRGSVLAAGYTGGKVCLWDVSTGKLTTTYADNHGWVRAVAFSPDGRLLATGRNDGTVSLWEASTGKLLFKKDKSDALSQIVSLAFSPDGKLLATGGGLNRVVIWKVMPSKKPD